MKLYFARNIFVLQLVVAVSYSSTSDNENDDSDEALEYEIYTDYYNGANIWKVKSEGIVHGPIKMKGSLRNRFALETFIANAEGTMTCSPVSVLLVLAKLALGADGECLTQLLDVLGLERRSHIKRAFKPFIKSLQYLKGVNLKMISKIYVPIELRSRIMFRTRAMKIFRSELSPVDFKQPATAVQDINEYVTLMTKGQINKTISEQDVSPESSLVLLNAVYFTGYWEKEFKIIEATEFYTPQAIRKVSMMSRRDKFKYARSDSLDSQLVELPYATGEASLLIILPNKRNNLPALLNRIKQKPDIIQQAAQTMQLTDIIVSIPKFRAEMKMDLQAILQKLGLTKIFHTRDSGLNGIIERGENVHVSKTVHSVVIDVTDLCFAGATSTGGKIHPIPPDVQVEVFDANHPFLYFVLFKKEQIFAGRTG